MDLEDDLSARPAALPLRRGWMRWALRGALAINVAWLAVLALVMVVPLPARATDEAWSTVVEYRDGRPAHVFLARDDKWRLAVDLERVDPKLVEALVALEDKRFWDHDGVDPIAIARAAISDVTHGRVVSGGSTLSMQLARMLEPRRRTIPAKLADMFRALQLDLRMSKREILAAYLAHAPYGKNLEGVESAAWAYFGHASAHLTPLEIATLLAVPQGPRRYTPNPGNVTRLRARRDDILRKLVDAGVFTGDDARGAIAEAARTAPPDRLTPMPREATHVATYLQARARGARTIRTTLDPGIQKLAEAEVALRVAEFHRKGIYNAAVVVVDHRTRDVVALVGNLAIDDWAHAGQIAMFARARSPGSTLKPFLYATAIDRGVALPEFLVPDVPTQYGTYRPKNFDGDWAGLVTLRDALSRSLNIPFVDLVNELGVAPFVGLLAKMNVRAALAADRVDQYGLSLIVGGIELSPLELAGMYATLAEDGTFRPLRLRASDPTPAAIPIVGAGAAYLTREALALRDRPDFPRRRSVNGMPQAIHWKTGTSFGFKDAWAAGSGPGYTAVVWTGNADNTASAELVGSEAAGPLLFDVLEGVADRAKAAGSVIATPPADLVEVEVCAYSGHLATEACEHTVKVRAPMHAVPTTVCPYHQAFEVDRVTHEAVTPACRDPERTYDKKSFVVLPSAVMAWFVDRHRELPEAPVFAAGCREAQVGIASAASGPPVIETPPEGTVLTLIPGVPTSQQQVPLAARTKARAVTWFVDGALLGTVAATERVFWTPTVGKHDVVVSDDAGRKAHRTLNVTLPHKE